MTLQEISTQTQTRNPPCKTNLRRSSSTAALVTKGGTLNFLRDSKSMAEHVVDELSPPSPQEKFTKKVPGEDYQAGIETKDALTGDTIMVSKEALRYNGKQYSINDIAHTWKKDCRMWLWKNGNTSKKMKSVSDHLRDKLSIN